MKVLQVLALLSAITSTTGVQAAAVADFGIYVDWSTLSMAGATMTPTSVTIPPQSGQSFSSDEEGWVGNASGDLDTASTLNNQSAIASYNDAVFNLVGGYDTTGTYAPVANASGGGAGVFNTGPGQQSGYAGGWHGLIYQATSTGTVTVSVDYSYGGNVSTDSFGEYASAGYSVFMDSADANLWISTYNDAITSGSSEADAEALADAASVLNEFSFDNWSLLTCFDVSCSDTTSPSGTAITDTMSVTFDVTAGTTYGFGADASANVYTDVYVSAIPVPAAIWLFGTGLICLVGLAKRKAHD
ncbi:MAG: hypothetical protein LJE83_11720 [Gammaproteobacteria bacterium]|nr:hypothetical protein [Gammaproteobacteria bacterium]